MDLRDLQIILELARSPFLSNEALGRRVGITGAAVKTRLGRMEEQETFLGIQLAPDPSALQRYWHIWAYENANPKLQLQKLLDLENVVTVFRGGHREILVSTFDLTRNADPPPGIRKILKDRPIQAVTLEPPGGGNHSESMLSPLDWRVMEAVIARPRAALNELSRMTGLSPRTIRNRRDRLLSGHHLLIFARIDTTRATGIIVYGGYIWAKSRDSLDRINVPGLALFLRHYEPPGAWFLGHADTLAGVQSTERDLRESPGVTGLTLGPARSAAFATMRLQAWVRAEIKRWDLARRASGR